MAGGKRCSRTFVKRTLVGSPGENCKMARLVMAMYHFWIVSEFGLNDSAIYRNNLQISVFKVRLYECYFCRYIFLVDVSHPNLHSHQNNLRLFAHPWSGAGSSPLMRNIHQINKWMINLTKQYENHGRCEYNLTLINDMPPLASHTSVGFKEEPHYAMGKASVVCYIEYSGSFES